MHQVHGEFERGEISAEDWATPEAFHERYLQRHYDFDHKMVHRTGRATLLGREGVFRALSYTEKYDSVSIA